MNISPNDMRLLVLTTDTPHHRYFLTQLLKFKIIDELVVVFETNRSDYRYSTSGLLDKEIFLHEKKIWNNLDLGTNVIFTQSINHLECIVGIGRFDFVINFGTGKLNSSAVRSYSEISKAPILNLHGGDLEKYRGLDTNLWAMWHNDTKSICVTMHELVEELDAGEVWLVGKLDGNKITPINLREHVTYVCIDLVAKLVATKTITPYKVKELGRYYSAMPAVIKNDLIKRYYKKF